MYNDQPQVMSKSILVVQKTFQDCFLSFFPCCSSLSLSLSLSSLSLSLSLPFWSADTVTITMIFFDRGHFWKCFLGDPGWLPPRYWCQVEGESLGYQRISILAKLTDFPIGLRGRMLAFLSGYAKEVVTKSPQSDWSVPSQMQTSKKPSSESENDGQKKKKSPTLLQRWSWKDLWRGG